jgi:hypothetical protein
LVIKTIGQATGMDKQVPAVIDPLLDCRLTVNWSSSAFVNDPTAAWCVDFGGGFVLAFGKTNNAGRYLNDRATKRAVWARSVELSFTLGVTARPMALLPLANWWQSGLGKRQILESRTLEVMEVFPSRGLCPNHFHALLNYASWEDILATVHDSQSRLFPFTYR